MTLLHNIRRKITALDAFPKVESNISDSTHSGGILTLVVSFVMVLLALSEFGEWWRVRHDYKFVVDTSIGDHMQLNLDVVIAMPCEFFTVDVIDVAGESLHVKHDFKSIPYDFDAAVANAKHSSKMYSTRDIDARKVIHNALKELSDNSPVVKLHQDVGGAKSASSTASTKACRVIGSVNVNKVAGNLHITAFGHGYGGPHIEHDAINFSHVVNKLSFGQHFPNKVDPLDGDVEISNDHFDLYQYFVSIVPTVFKDGFSSRTLPTNQFAVKAHKRNIDSSRGSHGLPGIFFKYEIESMSVVITATGAPFINTALRVCSIAGGIFVTVGIIHGLALNVLSRTKFYQRRHKKMPGRPVGSHDPLVLTVPRYLGNNVAAVGSSPLVSATTGGSGTPNSAYGRYPNVPGVPISASTTTPGAFASPLSAASMSVSSGMSAESAAGFFSPPAAHTTPLYYPQQQQKSHLQTPSSPPRERPPYHTPSHSHQEFAELDLLASSSSSFAYISTAEAVAPASVAGVDGGFEETKRA